MGMTLWIQTLDGDTLSSESDDHSLLYDLTEELDIACAALGQASLSSFFDTTDLEYNMADELDDEEFDADDDGEAELPYAINDMKWFAAASGIATLEALRATVAGNWKADLDAANRQLLVEEIDNCLAKLKELPAQSGRFHLAVIM